MKKGQTMKKRVLRLMKEFDQNPKTAKEISDIASTRWRWSPTVMQIAMICRTSAQIQSAGTVDVTSEKSRYRGILWIYQELTESGESSDNLLS
ncbi:hypothetical protein [Poseidonia sp.]|uniref:hypothetical protein n=1 Tax=Poseidonia sp. TaxID=2666344 RepID=UPI003F6A33D6